jgi:hypothetical protein
VQNVYWSIVHDWYPRTHGRAIRDGSGQQWWVELFGNLGSKLGVQVSE